MSAEQAKPHHRVKLSQTLCSTSNTHKEAQEQAQLHQIDVNSFLEDQSRKKSISLPLQFQFVPVEILSKEFTKLNNPHAYRIHYLGPRFSTTAALHKKYGHSERDSKLLNSLLLEGEEVDKYSVDRARIVDSYLVQERLLISNYYKGDVYYRAFEGMNPTLDLANQLIFNSAFQCGNLDCVIKLNQGEFDLFLRIDSNTRGHAQWFYFSVRNGAKKDKAKFNLVNLSKSKTLYEQGLKPYIFSRRKSELTSDYDWQQGAVNLGVNKKDLRYELLKEKDVNTCFPSLTLEYQFEFQDDEVFFAYCVPYSFSKLLHDINKLPVVYARKHILGKSLAGVDIPLLHISNHSTSQPSKKCILITGRIHPSETNSSHMLNIFMEFLTSSAKEANALRNRVDFFIVPIMNPDGVIIGNSRTSASGKDLNRQYSMAGREMYPEVQLLKDFAKKLEAKRGIFMFLDFHGHSRRKNTFMYGPVYTICEANYYKCRILPRLIEKQCSQFRFHSCSFTIDEVKKQTARAMMFKQIGVHYSYTVESSIGSYYDFEKKGTVPYSRKEWHTIGKGIALGVAKFVEGFEQYEMLLKERRASREKRVSVDRIGCIYEFQEDSFLCPRTQPLKIKYIEKSLFAELIEQLQSLPKEETEGKNPGLEEDSDDYDEDEDLESFRLKEFSNIVIKYEKQQSHKHERQGMKVKMQFKQGNTSRCEDEEEERFFEQMARKPKTSQGKRDQMVNGSSRHVNRRMASGSIRKKQLKEAEQPIDDAHENGIGHIRVDSLNDSVSPPQYGHKMSRLKFLKTNQREEKPGFFGQYRLLIDPNQDQKMINKIGQQHRISVFRRQRSKSIKQKKNQTKRTNHEGALLKDGQPQSNQIRTSHYNFQFRFDDLQRENKERSRVNFKSRISKTNVIRPASFYGIKKNLSFKINNIQKSSLQEQGDVSFRMNQTFHQISLL